MKQRNPIFVALAPFTLVFIAFIQFVGRFLTSSSNSGPNAISAVINLISIVFGVAGFVLLFYPLIWLVRTQEEMNKLGANIPTSLLLIVPIVSLYWFWCWSQGVEKVTGGKMSAILAFVLMMFFIPFGMLLVQMEFNKVSPQPSAGGAAPAGTTSGMPAYGAPQANAFDPTAQQNPPYGTPQPVQPGIGAQNPMPPGATNPVDLTAAPQPPTMGQQPPTTPA